MIHTVKDIGIVTKAKVDVFLELSVFSMIQMMLAIWSLVPLAFLNPAWTSGTSQFMYCWNLTWRILSITLLTCLVQFSRSVVSDSLRPHESRHVRPPCASPTLGVYPNSCPLSRWCHPATSSSVIPFSSCPQSLSASGSFPMSQLFTWGGQSTGVSYPHWVLHSIENSLFSFNPVTRKGWTKT